MKKLIESTLADKQSRFEYIKMKLNNLERE